MKKSVTVTLERQARKKGGDRYLDKGSGYTTYIPQSISRSTNGIPLKKIKITFEDE